MILPDKPQVKDHSLLNEDPNPYTYSNVEIGISSFVFLVNIVEMIIIKRKRNKKNFERLLISLSTVDMLYGILNATLNAIRKNNLLKFRRLSINFHMLFVIASIFHLLCIAGDRLFAVSKPITHNVFSTPKKIYTLAIACWLLSFIVVGLFQIYTPPIEDKFDSNGNNHTLYSNQSIVEFNETWSNLTKNDEEAPPSRPLMKLSSGLNGTRSNEGVDQVVIAKENITSCCIITCDIILLILYILFAYFIQNSSRPRLRSIFIGMLVPLSFTLFTLPYAIISLKYKVEVSFIPNVLLVSNSGFNSLIYFFRDFCKRRNRRNNVAPINVNQANPTEQKSRPKQEADVEPMQSSSKAGKQENNNRKNRVIPNQQSNESQSRSCSLHSMGTNQDNLTSSQEQQRERNQMNSTPSGCKNRIRRNKVAMAMANHDRHQSNENQQLKSSSTQVTDSELTQGTPNGCKNRIRRNKVAMAITNHDRQHSNENQQKSSSTQVTDSNTRVSN